MLPASELAARAARVLCCFRLHDWYGCKCTRCGVVRHDWQVDSCNRCRAKRELSDIARQAPMTDRILCALKLHKPFYQGSCLCTRCGVYLHDWFNCVCRTCGCLLPVNEAGHDWQRCKCRTCGRCRDVAHDWNGCVCRVCHRKRDSEHSWDSCICTRCRQKRPLAEHHWDVCTCTRCGAISAARHEWDRWLCRKCGAVEDEDRLVERLRTFTIRDWRQLDFSPHYYSSGTDVTELSIYRTGLTSRQAVRLLQSECAREKALCQEFCESDSFTCLKQNPWHEKSTIGAIDTDFRTDCQDVFAGNSYTSWFESYYVLRMGEDEFVVARMKYSTHQRAE